MCSEDDLQAEKYAKDEDNRGRVAHQENLTAVVRPFECCKGVFGKIGMGKGVDCVLLGGECRNCQFIVTA